MDTTPTYGRKPTEYLRSVDLCLQLMTMLKDSGSLTISGASQFLGAGQSSVHRSLGMLVYRGFAVQAEDRSYVVGPALQSPPLPHGVNEELLRACTPFMRALVEETQETVHIHILSGDTCRVINSLEGKQSVRVGSRVGQILPAHKTAGGMIMLSHLSGNELRETVKNVPESEFADFRRRLYAFRKAGYAINHGQHERDVSAIATAIVNEFGDVLGALTISIPTARFSSVKHSCTVSLLRVTQQLSINVRQLLPPDN